ncbi:MAG: FHIPEP family type III secretion protein [Acidimicrobiia bacterium]|nr:FHIPEP family type III secretion protein [Acidimicrobiia bacterium]
MSTTPLTNRTQVGLSFCRDYATAALRLAGELEDANLVVAYDQWEGTARSARRTADIDLAGANAIVVLFSPSEGTPTWIGDAWKRSVYQPAVRREVPVLGVRWDDCAIPDFLSHLDFADMHRRGYGAQVHRLLRSVAAGVEFSTIIVPSEPDPDSGDAAFSAIDLSAPPSVVARVGSAFDSLVDPQLADEQAERIAMVRDGLFYELGVQFPKWSIEVETDAPDDRMIFALNGVVELELAVPPGRVMVNDTAEEVHRRGFDALEGHNPASGNRTAWVPTDVAPAIERAGLTTWDLEGFLILTLSALLREKAADFIGVREARVMLDRLREAFPLLVVEAVPGTVSELVFADVLRRLVSERVSIRNLRRILLALLEWGRVEDDTLMLSEYVRAGLRDETSHRLSRGSSQLLVLLLHPELEQEIKSAIRHTSTGSFVDLPAERVEAIVECLRDAVDALGEGVQIPSVLTIIEIRATVQRLLRRAIPGLWVVSYQELSPRQSIQPIGRVSPDIELSLRGFSAVSPWGSE